MMVRFTQVPVSSVSKGRCTVSVVVGKEKLAMVSSQEAVTTNSKGQTVDE